MSKLRYKLGNLAPIYQNTETGEVCDNAFAGVAGWEKTNLVCDVNTKIVYYAGTGAPYISQIGTLCHLDDEKLKITEVFFPLD